MLPRKRYDTSWKCMIPPEDYWARVICLSFKKCAVFRKSEIRGKQLRIQTWIPFMINKHTMYIAEVLLLHLYVAVFTL